MKTTALVYLSHPLAFEYVGGQSLADRFVTTLLEVRNVDNVAVYLPRDAPGTLEHWSDLGCYFCKDMSRAMSDTTALTDEMCIDAYAHCLDGESPGPDNVVACVPFMPFLPAAKIELMVRKLGRYTWSGPCHTRPAVIPNAKGGTRRVNVDVYLGCVRAFKATLRNESKPWDNSFGGVECDAVESLTVSQPADRRLTEELLAG